MTPGSGPCEMALLFAVGAAVGTSIDAFIGVSSSGQRVLGACRVDVCCEETLQRMYPCNVESMSGIENRVLPEMQQVRSSQFLVSREISNIEFAQKLDWVWLGHWHPPVQCPSKRCINK